MGYDRHHASWYRMRFGEPPLVHYRRTKRDANHKAIVDALLAMGATVVDLAAVGKGCPDLLVGLCGCNYLLEIKNPLTKRGQQGTTGKATAEKQGTFRKEWRGRKPVTVESVDAALAAIGALNVLHPAA